MHLEGEKQHSDMQLQFSRLKLEEQKLALERETAERKYQLELLEQTKRMRQLDLQAMEMKEKLNK